MKKLTGLTALLAPLLLAACQGGSDKSTAPQQDLDNVDAMSDVHSPDTTDPAPAIEAPPKRPVVSEVLPYAEVDSELVYGHFALPEDMVDPLPAIIVIHEWWGLNDNVRAMADRLAGEGYIVLAVDLFGGKVAGNPAEARSQMIEVVENPDGAIENLRQAIAFVDEVAEAPSIATLGWCFGGGWSLNAALQFPDKLDATVIYYGQVTSDTDRLQALSSPVMGFFGGADRGISVDSVRGFESALEELGKDATIHVYPGVGHAFANPTGRNYDETAAEDAWAKTLEFLRQELEASADASAAPASSPDASSG